ncbi:MAG TPA: TonB-dependent receptor, partial [Thermoanaerobaculia bacterium]|nr:TonB-dependent receptor [Thermoanaerobaculia bacterium]
ARVDYWKNHDGYEGTLGGEMTTYPSHETTQLNPRVAVRKELRPGLAIRGSAFRAFHAPELRELYRTGGSRNNPILPNPELGPEVLTGADAGVVFGTPGARAEINVFWNEIDDTVAAVPVSTDPTLIFINRNIGSSRSRGVEVFARWTPAPSWSIDGGYVYADAVVTNAPSQETIEGNRIADIPDHTATLEVSWFPAGPFSARVRSRHQSERYFDAENTFRFDPFTVVDLHLSYQWNDALKLFADVENLFDETYLAEFIPDRRLGPPTHVHAGFRWRSGR